MKLRSKTLLIVGTTLLFLLVILNTVSRQVLLSGFARVELEDTERNVKRVLDAFTEAVNNLSIKAADWAKWDDTYQFVNDRNAEYIQSNLTDESLAELKLNLMLFFDSTGRVAYSRSYDLEKEAGEPVAAADLAVVSADTMLMRHQSIQSVVAGVTLLSGGPMNIVSRPVLTSSGGGPIAGTIVFGRYIDAAEVERIGQITHLSLAVHTCGAASLPDDIVEANGILDGEMPRYIHPLSDNRIAGYARINDIHDHPVLLLRTDMQRDIHRQGKRTMTYLLVTILAAGIIFGIVIVVLLQRTVLSRVAKLSGDVNTIAGKGDHSARVSIDGNDELTGLVKTVNKMLSSLERVEGVVHSRNREMGMLMKTVPVGLLSIDEQFIINPEYSASVGSLLGIADVAGRDFFEVIGLTGERAGGAAELREYLDLVLREPLSEREMAGLNPFEEHHLVRRDGSDVWLRLRFYIIRREESSIKHLLVVIEDITEAKALSVKVAESASEITRLRVIAGDPDLFREFLVEMRRSIVHVNESLGRLRSGVEEKLCVNDIFREVHTMKGAADVFGLGTVVGIASQLEESVGDLRSAKTITDLQLTTTAQSVGALQLAVTEVEESVNQILGTEAGDANNFHVRISLEKLNEVSRAILDRVGLAVPGGDTQALVHREICLRLKSLREIPAQRALARALKLVPGLLRRFEKNIQFELEGAEVLLDIDTARELVGPLIHLLRNAVDHGIEFPEERTLAGKTVEGQLRIIISKTERSITVQVSDNGRGLDPVKLRQVAVTKGIISNAVALQLSDDEARNLILRPGFTTAEVATDISGRGVGMDAVAAAVARLRGTITIDSQTGQGTVFTITVPCGES